MSKLALTKKHMMKNGLVRNIRTSFSLAMAATADIILPRYCTICGRRLLSAEQFICIYCLGEFPFTHFWKLEHNRMADKFNEMIQSETWPRRATEDGAGNEADIQDREPYGYAAALFMYRDDAPYRKIQYRLKYKGDTGCGRFFGKMLGDRLAGSGLFSNADVVIPVPLHWTRLWQRGYNQAEVIAKEIAGCLGAGLRTDILVRTRKTKTQTKLDVESKRENVRNAFSVRPDSIRAMADAAHIILVDDVFTTGATIFECFRALRKAAEECEAKQKARISAVTLGFVDSG